MARAKYYSPRLEHDLISRLYHQAKAERVPMTALASRLVREGLASPRLPASSPRSRPPTVLAALAADAAAALPVKF